MSLLLMAANYPSQSVATQQMVFVGTYIGDVGEDIKDRDDGDRYWGRLFQSSRGVSDLCEYLCRDCQDMAGSSRPYTVSTHVIGILPSGVGVQDLKQSQRVRRSRSRVAPG